jgi:hypothetical protein
MMVDIIQLVIRLFPISQLLNSRPTIPGPGKAKSAPRDSPKISYIVSTMIPMLEFAPCSHLPMLQITDGAASKQW